MASIRKLVKKVPGVTRLRELTRRGGFRGTADYWEQRYRRGGNSGDGSYGKLAEFKAEVLNDLVAREGIRTVLELGCGDGHQLGLARYPSYVGYDISPAAVQMCRERFAGDDTKRFEVYDAAGFHEETPAELSLSLDVLYHLVEDELFDTYIEHLFGAATRFVAVYALNFSEAECARLNAEVSAAHVRHRPVADLIAARQPDWTLAEHVPNRYPMSKDGTEGSFADFLIYTRAG